MSTNTNTLKSKCETIWLFRVYGNNLASASSVIRLSTVTIAKVVGYCCWMLLIAMHIAPGRLSLAPQLREDFTAEVVMSQPDLPATRL